MNSIKISLCGGVWVHFEYEKEQQKKYCLFSSFHHLIPFSFSLRVPISVTYEVYWHKEWDLILSYIIHAKQWWNLTFSILGTFECRQTTVSKINWRHVYFSRCENSQEKGVSKLTWKWLFLSLTLCLLFSFVQVLTYI